LTHLGSVILGQQPVVKKQSEEQEESAEKLIQSVSSSDKTQMYNALIGNTEKEVGINDNEQ
jgi:ABC-type polar amino acid transport system ATPase subunit